MSNDRHTISQISLLLLLLLLLAIAFWQVYFFGDKLKLNKKANRGRLKKIHEIKQTLRIYMARHLARLPILKGGATQINTVLKSVISVILSV